MLKVAIHAVHIRRFSLAFEFADIILFKKMYNCIIMLFIDPFLIISHDSVFLQWLYFLFNPLMKFSSIFQHMRSHNNDAAWSNQFYDLLTSNISASPAVRSLKNRCLGPGLYAEHLERWMLHFPVSQVNFPPEYSVWNLTFIMHYRVWRWTNVFGQKLAMGCIFAGLFCMVSQEILMTKTASIIWIVPVPQRWNPNASA
jgi:hypothetical protein